MNLALDPRKRLYHWSQEQLELWSNLIKTSVCFYESRFEYAESDAARRKRPIINRAPY